MGLYLEVLKFWGKDKIKKYTDLCSGFCFGVYSIYSLYLVTHLTPFQSLDPCPQKILDARL